MPEAVEVYQPPEALPVLDRSEMNALFKLAKALSDTSFAPNTFKGKPFECLAAILTGRELGIGPMESLTQIHVIQGRPTLSAQLMRALVLRQGHSIQEVEATKEVCTLKGKRRDNGDTAVASFSIEDAKKAGLVRKGGGWEAYTDDMLWARATSKLCRRLFADCLAGAAYVPEEIGGEPAPEDVQPARFEPPTMADAVIDRVEYGEVTITNEPLGTDRLEESLNAAQRAKLFASARDKGVDAHSAASDALGCEVTSINDLSREEASTVIQWIEALPPVPA